MQSFTEVRNAILLVMDASYDRGEFYHVIYEATVPLTIIYVT